MKIIIVGGGKVGRTLTTQLAHSNHEVTVIETQEKILKKIIDSADATGVLGSGIDKETQLEAGVDRCDMFIAVTEADEINMMASIIANQLGAPTTLARVRRPEYTENMEFIREGLGITRLINPERESSIKIYETLKYPPASTVETFMDGTAGIVGFVLSHKNPLVDKPLKNIHKFYKDILVCIVERNNEVFIPNGEFILRVGDKVHITADPNSLEGFFNGCGYTTTTAEKILIVGGGQIGYYLTERLLAQGKEVKVIEIDPKRAEFLSGEFPDAHIVLADGTDHDTLLEERAPMYDALIAATGIDEENIILAIYAQSKGIPEIIPKISTDPLEIITHQLNLDSIIVPKDIIADEILRFVISRLSTRTSEMEALHRMVMDQVHGVQFKVKQGFSKIGVPLKDYRLKPDTLVALIQRNNEILYPSGNTAIEIKDKVLIVTKDENIDNIEDVVLNE